MAVLSRRFGVVLVFTEDFHTTISRRLHKVFGGCTSSVLPNIISHSPFLDGHTYETVLTNLPTDSFPSCELKKFYAIRWGIETSFKELKYTLGILKFHAKKT